MTTYHALAPALVLALVHGTAFFKQGQDCEIDCSRATSISPRRFFFDICGVPFQKPTKDKKDYR